MPLLYSLATFFTDHLIYGLVKIFSKRAQGLIALIIFDFLSFSLPAVASDVPSLSGIPNTGNFVARFIEDRDNIAVVDLSGNYDESLGDGKFNIEPRAVIAREFYKKHPDAYDFLVVFSSFEFATGNALAFHHAVKRNIQGIGDLLPIDNTASYGSAGRLQGFIDMAALSRYSTNPLNTDFDQVLQTFSHEFMHQWVAFVRFKESNGTLSNDLITGDGHWSFLLDSDASIMYGNHWRDNGDGTFTSVEARDHFSLLDLYLMGLIGKEKVLPMMLLVAPGEDKTRVSKTGVTITAVSRTITIDDIIAAEGSRLPSVHDSQKDFRFAFIYIKRPGETVNTGQLAALANIRREVGIRFNALTQGLATANVFVDSTGVHVPGEPEVIVTPGPGQVLADSTGAALTWLKQQQKGTGEWRDTDATAVRDTAYVLHAFKELQPASPVLPPGITWLQNKTSETADALARQIIASQIVQNTSSSATYANLLTQQNSDGGWGFATGFLSNPLDTALAMQAIRKRQGDQATPLKNARTYLATYQNADGGWGNTAQGGSRVTTTGQALLALLRDGVSDSMVAKAAGFISGKQNSDGGFGDSPSSLHDTAQTINTLMEAGTLVNIRVSDAMQYLAANQQFNGSWENSVYTTALAARALNNSRIMNWAIDSFSAEPQTVTDGLPVMLKLRVRNTGGVAAPVTKIRVYDGNPESGGIPIRADIALPILVAGATADVSIPWSTLGKAGAHTLFAIVDPDSEHQELTRTDNTASLAYTVKTAAAGIELFVTDADLSVTPQYPGQLPVSLTISALLTNAGTLPAKQVHIVLWEGSANQPKTKLIGETMIDMPPRATTPVQFTVTLSQGGKTVYTVEIDPENKIAESDKTNNTASIVVSPESSLDLAVDTDILMAPESGIRLGSDISFTVRLRNNGTIDSPTAQVRYTIIEGGVEYEIRTNNVQLIAGQSTEQKIDWRADREGTLAFKAQIDPQGLLNEADRTNNIAQKSFFVGERLNGLDLAVSFKDISFDPDPGLEGQPLAIKAQIRNIGTVDASAFEVAFFAGVPGEGGIEIADRKKVNALAVDESIEIVGIWGNLDRGSDQLIDVVVDPDQVLNDTNRANNHAFVVLKIETLPDLAISNGDITASPALPKPGDSVQISAQITNFGQQTANGIVVRLYEGDPAIGGHAVGEDQQIETLPTQTSAAAHFVYPMGSNAQTLYVVIDPNHLIAERHKENNKASITLLSQNQDFYVSERYFSPNGDGIKDTTGLSFRLPEARTVHIEVVNEKNGRVVRHSPEFTQVTAGAWEWDGTNDRGSVARDGGYLLRVIDAAGTVYGEAAVELDTNRLSALDAIGTPYGVKKQPQFQGNPLSGGWGTHGPDGIVSAGDDSKHYYIDRNINIYTKNYGGVYQLDVWGDPDSLVLPGNSEISWTGLLLNYSGSVMVLAADYLGPSGKFEQEIWTANGDGSHLFKVASLSDSIIKLYDGQLLLISEEDNSLLLSQEYSWGQAADTKTLWRLPLVKDAIPVKVWEQGGYGAATGCHYPGQHYPGQYYPEGGTLICAHEEISPDGSTVLFTATGAGEATQVTDLRSGQEQSLLLSSTKWVWSPDSHYFAGWAEIKGGPEKVYGMVIADRQGNIVYQKSYQPRDRWVNYGVWGGDGKFYFTEFDGCEGEGVYSCRIVRLKAIAPGSNLDGVMPYEENGQFIVAASGCGLIDDDYSPDRGFFNTGFFNGDKPDVREVPATNTLTLKARGLASIVVPNQQQALFNGRRVDLDWANEGEPVLFPQVGPWVGFDVGVNLIPNLLPPLPPITRLPEFQKEGALPGRSCAGASFDLFWQMRAQFLGRLSTSGKEIYYDYPGANGGNSTPWVFHNLQNLTAKLYVIREPDGRSFKIKGTASDKNFYRYTLDYSASDAPEVWRAIVPAADTPVVDDVMVPLWVPPGIGTYLVRLAVEDLAGNKQQIIKRVSVSVRGPALSDFHLEPEWISPNGDGVQDEAKLSYVVQDIGSFEFNIYSASGVLIRTILKEYTTIGESYLLWDGRDNNNLVVKDGEYKITILNYSFTVNVDNTPPAPIPPSAKRPYPPGALKLSEAFGVLMQSKKWADPENPYGTECLPPDLINKINPRELSPLNEGEERVIDRNQVCFSGQLDWAIEEINPRSITIETFDSVLGQWVPGGWVIQGQGIEWKQNFLDTQPIDEDGYWTLEYRSVQLKPDEYMSGKRRIVVEDKAGNKLISEANAPEQKIETVKLSVWYSEETESGEEIALQDSADAVYYVGRRSTLNIKETSNVLVFDLVSTISGVRVASINIHGKNGTISLPLKNCFPHHDCGESFSKTPYISGFLNFREAALESNWIYSYQIVLEDSTGNQYTTPAHIFLLRGDWLSIEKPYSFPEGTRDMLPPKDGVAVNNIRWTDLLSGDKRDDIILEDRLAFAVRETSGKPGIPVKFFLQSSDARFINPVFLGKFITESVEGDESRQYSEFRFVKGDNFLSCIPYEIIAIAITGDENDDRIYDYDEGRYVWGKRHAEIFGYCGKISIVASPHLAGCNEPPSNILNIDLTPDTKGIISIDHMVFGRKKEDGSDDIFFNVVNPVSGGTYSTQIHQSVLAQGENVWFARMTDADGKITERETVLVGEHTAPSLRVTYPEDGQKVCARKDVSYGRVVDIFAEADAAAGWGYFLEQKKIIQYESPSVRREEGWGKIGGRCDFTESSSEENIFFIEENYPYLYSLLRKAIYIPPRPKPFMGRQSGGVGFAYTGRDDTGFYSSIIYSDAEDGGKAQIRIRLVNWAGALLCQEVTFYVDAEVQAEARKGTVSLFSPALERKVEVFYKAQEPLVVSATVYPIKRDENTNIEIVDRDHLIRHLASDVEVAAGDVELMWEWDGHDDNGAIVDDGDYTIDVYFRDACGNTEDSNDPSSKFRPFRFEVDSTPPVVNINTPHSGPTQSMLVGVMGSVSDKNLTMWWLEYAAGSDPEDGAWIELTRGGDDVDDALLKDWNTYGLSGEYTLRLRAIDEAGNEAETRVVVQIGDMSTELLSDASVEPVLFSPNGDGKLDWTTVRYTLLNPAWMTIEITGQGITPRILQAWASQTAGGHSLVWDGLDGAGKKAPDGTYEIRLTAELLADISVKQVETLHAVIDNTPPQLAINSPSATVVKGSTAITGSVADLHAGHYRLSVKGPLPGGAEQIIEEGEGALLNYRFGDLSQLQEAEYALTLSATDLAENTSSLTVQFEVDNTPPVVTISAPPSNQFVGGTVPVPVVAAVVEKHPKHWVVTLGQGPPENWKTLYEGAALPLPGDMKLIPADYIDGDYTLRLYANDLAGWESFQDITVRIDNTPPTVELTTPADGAYVKDTTDVIGTAADVNLKSYTLELAPGHGDEATRWTTIAEGTSSVTADILGTLPLPPDGPYTLRLTAVDLAGNSATVANEIIVSTKGPIGGIHLTAELENETQVRLNWTASPDPTTIGYHIERNGYRITTELVTVLTYLDASPGEGEFTYVVYAVNRAGWETASNPATVTINLGSLHAAIVQPKEGDTVSGTVDIRGTAYADNGFKEYKLSVAAGAAPASDQYQLLRRSPLSVRSDTLGTWNTTGLPEGAVYTLLLEAFDIYGNTRQAKVTVTVDNLPPAKPTGLVATPQGYHDILVTWNPNTEPDLDGYLLYRDGVLVNAGDEEITLLKPYILKETVYLDKGLPDGEYTYVVEAVDLAGNISEPSDPATAVLANQPPRATIVQPETETRVNHKTYLLAVSRDKDIVRVQIEYRPAGMTEWQPVGNALTKEPYGVDWDPSGLNYGAYEFRAVATDVTDLTDPEPPVMRLIYTNQLERVLTAHVDGGEVTLTWAASYAAGLDHYTILRGPRDASWQNFIGQTPIGTVTYIDQDVDDAEYIYQVQSIGLDNYSEVDEKLSVGAIVHTPKLRQPFTPIAGRSTELKGSGRTPNAVEITLVNSSGTSIQSTPQLDAQGSFSATLTLVTADNRMSVILSDDQGNRSKKAAAHVITGDAPAAPQDVTGTVAGATVSIDWIANQEADLWGYLVGVDGKLRSEPWGGGTASASTDWVDDPASRLAIDGDEATYWSLQDYDFAYGVEPWFVYQAATPAQVTTATLQWNTKEGAIVPDRFDLEGWDGEVWVPLKEVSGNKQTETMIDLGNGYRTDKLRLHFYKPTTALTHYEIRLAEFEAQQAPVVTETHWEGELANGSQAVTVKAVNLLGLVGPPSAAVILNVVGETLSPPENLVVTVPPVHRTLDLSWQPPSSGKTPTAYSIYRSLTAGGPYDRIQTAPATQLTYRDGNLNAATRYYYVVRAEDALGNQSEPSNEASGVPTSPFDVPYLFYPATPAIPATVPDLTTTIFGMAPPASTVRLDSSLKAGVKTSQALADTTELAYQTPSLQYLDWSPDGSLFVTRQPFGFALYKMMPGTAAPQLLQTIDHGSPKVPAISPDNRYVAFIGNNTLTLLRVADGLTMTKPLPEAAVPAGELVWSRDGKLFATGIASGLGALYVLETPLGAFRELQRVTVSGESYNQLHPSPDGTAVAYVRVPPTTAQNTLEIFSLADNAVAVVDASLNGISMAWEKDARGLYYATYYDYLKMYKTASAAADTYFSVYLPYGSSLAASPYDNMVAFQENTGSIQIYDISSDKQRPLVEADNIVSFNWLPSGYLTYTLANSEGWRHVRQAPAGLVRFDGVPLQPGDNTFTIRTVDPTEGEGPTSEPVLIRALNEALPLPDLEVLEQDIISLPGVPWLGETAKVSVKVRNIGAVGAPAADIAVAVKDPTGNVMTLLRGKLPPLAVGASAMVSMDWMPAVTGAHQIVVSVDAANAIQEADKTNNVAVRSFNVMREDVTVSMTLALDGSAYQAAQDVTGTFTLINGGAALDGTLNVFIEDAQGYLVTQLPAISVAHLASGEQRKLSAVWNTGSTLPGDYRMRGVLRDTQGAELTEAIALFAINAAAMTVDARLLTDRDSYPQGSTVQLYGTVDFAGFLPGQANVPAAIIVYDSANQEVYRYPQMLSPSTQADVRTSWATGSAAAGNYQAVLIVGDESRPLAQATAVFALLGARATMRYEGDLTLAADQVLLGNAVQAQAILRNTGGLAIAQLPALITVVDPKDDRVLAQERRVIDLPLGAAATIDVAFPTQNWPLRRLNVLLQIEASSYTPDGLTQTLQQKPVSIFETDPPIVTILQPVDGIIVRNVAAMYGTAYDLLSGVRSVEYQLDGGNWAGMLFSNPQGNVYSAALPPLVDGEHQLVMRATDDFNNTGMSLPVRFIIDTIPPLITITGVTQGGAYNTAVTPMITVTDLHLDTVVTTLNGQPFASGTTLSATGSYVLFVTAADKAGNQSTQTVSFTINRDSGVTDTTPPVVAITRPIANTYLKAAGDLEATIVDAESGVKNAEYRIDSGGWNALPQVGMPASHYQAAMGALADGVYTASARATDNAGNVSLPVSVTFIVDATPPTITITGVAQGGVYTTAVTPVIVIYDLNLDTSSITLNGTPFVSGTGVSVHAHYVLMATATDKAGNQTTVALSFDLKAADTTPPLVVITRPIANTYLKAAGNLEASIVDTESGVKNAEYRVVGGNWNALPQVGVPVSHYQAAMGTLADGIYTAFARATDNADNVSLPVSVRFTVDATPPQIIVTGVEDRRDYDETEVPVVPVVTIIEVNPDIETMTLNGQPFVSGTALADAGGYVLYVEAIDKAGNRSEKTVRFSLLAGRAHQDAAPIPWFVFAPWLLLWYGALSLVFLVAVRQRFRDKP